MSLPSQCELVRRVRETALAAVSSFCPPPDFAADGPSAMEQDGAEEISASAAVQGVGTAGGDGENGVGTAVEAWAELLPLERNWHKTVYTLQIVDALLLPAPVRSLFWSLSWLLVAPRLCAVVSPPVFDD